MATIIIDIPTGIAARLTEAFVQTYGYKPTLPDGSANPETKAQFAQRMIREYAKSVLIGFEAQTAGETARVAADTKAKGDFGA